MKICVFEPKVEMHQFTEEVARLNDLITNQIWPFKHVGWINDGTNILSGS